MAIKHVLSQNSTRRKPFQPFWLLLVVFALMFYSRSLTKKITSQVVYIKSISGDDIGDLSMHGGATDANKARGLGGRDPCTEGEPNSRPMAMNAFSTKLPDHGSPFYKAAPWLLPPQYAELPYSGIHDLERLADMQSSVKGGYKAITVLFFSRGMTEMLQNCIYSMVKFGNVDNYIVGVWTEADLEACAELNLPCANVVGHLPRPLGSALAPDSQSVGSEKTGASSEGYDIPDFGSREFNAIMWTKPAVVKHLLDLGYAVHSSDIDVAYAPKDVWLSYLKYLNVSGADAAFQAESAVHSTSPINSGNYIVLPNNRSRTMMEAWMNYAEAGIEEGGNQGGLMKVYNNGGFTMCEASEECLQASKHISQDPSNGTVDGQMPPEKAESDRPALIRTFNTAGWELHQNYCAFSGDHPVPNIDPCSLSVMFVHPICTGGPRIQQLLTKTRVFREVGFWFLDDGGPQGSGCPTDTVNAKKKSHGVQSALQKNGTPRCVPLVILEGANTRQHAESTFEACTNSIAFE